MKTASEAVEAVDAYTSDDKKADTESDTPEKSDAPVADTPIEDDGTTSDKTEPADKTDPAEKDAGADETTKSEPLDDHLTKDEAEQMLNDAENVEAASAEPKPADDPTQLPVAPQVVRETTIERKGGFVPMLLGGVAAAALGYGVAAYVSQDVWPFASTEPDAFEGEVRETLATQDGSLADLSTRLETLESTEIPTVDLTPMEEQIAALQTTANDTSARLDEITSRLDALEKRPMEQAVSPEAIAAYERALEDLQAEVEAQRAEVTQMAKEAVEAESNAETKSTLAASRAAMAEITAALETGSGYTNAIDVLSANGVDIPEPLAANAQTGVVTQGALIDNFPAAARSALSAARNVQTEGSEGANRVTTFFANQLGARSVAPREGNDPDAVLSRAEAEVRAGNIEAALSELSALPEEAQNALADWRASAQTRVETKTAADALVQQLLQE
ncbi:hypothetical protein [Marivita sp. S2033]|uniref:hypothetical protein n=1 Tax=Marivita sp. S2033 TaxID=3373187 RepID=UPI0039825797